MSSIKFLNLGRLLGLLLLAVLVLFGNDAYAEDDRLKIYIDADYTTLPAPAVAIELGLKTAFHGTWAENEISIVPMDHRGNVRRSFDTLQQAARDSSAIAVIGGMHSPPYIVHGQKMNAMQMPLLLPWSSDAALTRHAQGADNWTFRLSADDAKAAPFLANQSLSRGCRKISTLAVKNAWGENTSNRIAATLQNSGMRLEREVSIHASAGQQMIAEAAVALEASKSDCIILMVNAPLGISILRALAKFDTPPMVLSHSGLLGVRLSKHISMYTLHRLRLKILGTCDLRERGDVSTVHNQAMQRASVISGMPFLPGQHPAVHGFYHAHDLGFLVLNALEKAREHPEWGDGIHAQRQIFRDTLYELDDPIVGVLKTYQKPFTPTGPENPDGHEALDAQDHCLLQFDARGQLQHAK